MGFYKKVVSVAVTGAGFFQASTGLDGAKSGRLLGWKIRQPLGGVAITAIPYCTDEDTAITATPAAEFVAAEEGSTAWTMSATVATIARMFDQGVPFVGPLRVGANVAAGSGSLVFVLYLDLDT